MLNQRVLFFPILTIAAAGFIAFAPVASAQTCTIGNSIHGTCKASAGAGELDTAANSIFSTYRATEVCPSSLRCVVTQGSNLCSGFVLASGVSADRGSAYACVAQPGDCVAGTTLDAASLGQDFPVCPTGQVCCQRSAAGAPTAKGSLPGAAASGKGATTVSYGLRNPLGSRNLNDIAAALIKYASGIAGTLMLVYMIWGGVQYMTASDQKAVQDAQKRILWAVIGVAVIFFAYVVIDAIISLSNLAPGM